MRNKKTRGKRDKFMRFWRTERIGIELTIDNGQLTIIGATDVLVFGIRRFKHTPTSEIVGNGLCAVPGTPRLSRRKNEEVCRPTRNKSFPRGKLARPRARLMRECGTAFRIVGTTGAEGLRM